MYPFTHILFEEQATKNTKDHILIRINYNTSNSALVCSDCIRWGYSQTTTNNYPWTHIFKANL